MKFMLMMNGPRGNGDWDVAKWPLEDLKAHIGFMTNTPERNYLLMKAARLGRSSSPSVRGAASVLPFEPTGCVRVEGLLAANSSAMRRSAGAGSFAMMAPGETTTRLRFGRSD